MEVCVERLVVQLSRYVGNLLESPPTQGRQLHTIHFLSSPRQVSSILSTSENEIHAPKHHSQSLCVENNKLVINTKRIECNI